jgi:hypothetical protein
VEVGVKIPLDGALNAAEIPVPVNVDIGLAALEDKSGVLLLSSRRRGRGPLRFSTGRLF